MSRYPQAEELKKKLETAREVLVVLPMAPQLDQVAAGLALQLSLEKQGKRVNGVAPRPMTVEFSRLVGVEKITARVGNKNLVISWPHEGDVIEKISYHVDEEAKTFNVVVEPRAGFPAVDRGQVRLEYTGVRADLVFLVGAKYPDDLGELADELGGVMGDGAQLVRVDTRPHSRQGKAVDVIDDQVSSLSELVWYLLSDLALVTDADVATNLIQGIYQRTGSLANPAVGPETFEVVAKLLRAGARRPQRGMEGKSDKLPADGGAGQGEVVAQSSGEKTGGQQSGVEELAAVGQGSESVPEPEWLQKPKVYSGGGV